MKVYWGVPTVGSYRTLLIFYDIFITQQFNIISPWLLPRFKWFYRCVYDISFIKRSSFWKRIEKNMGNINNIINTRYFIRVDFISSWSDPNVQFSTLFRRVPLCMQNMKYLIHIIHNDILCGKLIFKDDVHFQFILPLTTTSLSSGGVSMSVLSVVEECGRWHLSSRSPADTGRCWPPHLRSAHSPLAHDPAHNITPSHHHGLTWGLSLHILSTGETVCLDTINSLPALTTYSILCNFRGWKLWTKFNKVNFGSIWDTWGVRNCKELNSFRSSNS